MEISIKEKPTQHMLDVWDYYHGKDLGECDFDGGTVDDLNNLNLFFNRDVPYAINHKLFTKDCQLYKDSKPYINTDIASAHDSDPVGVDNRLNKIFNDDHIVVNKNFINNLIN